MTLQESIEYIRKITPEYDGWTVWDFVVGDDEPMYVDEAIATILNAVVKGELK